MSSTSTNPNQSKSSFTSIVRDSFTSSSTSASSNRELSNDKSTLITSLNYNLSHLNSSSNSNSNSTSSLSQPNNTSSNSQNNHFYQNVSHFKQLQNILQTSMNGNDRKPNDPPANQPSFKLGQPPSVPSTPIPAQPSQTAKTTANMPKTRVLDGYVGFANLPNQVYRKSVKKGFEFNLMVIGESGLGKSTFINSLFLAELYNPADFPNTFERKKKTTFIDSTTVLLSEKGVNLRLAIIDTPGFGDSIDNTNCWQPIIDFIDNKYEEYLNAESKINRKLPIGDQRVHCCLHFIAPGHT